MQIAEKIANFFPFIVESLLVGIFVDLDHLSDKLFEISLHTTAESFTAFVVERINLSVDLSERLKKIYNV